ncbi:unnamed protein product, partial [Mesorhabditis belari]|uniref:CS domain-containing protein n=1 Tax=Mesorhabditis belari TaxID=2138241 RepID=A0AAF3EN27_9BILA
MSSGSPGSSAPPLPKHGNVHNAPGPLGCRYTDSLHQLEIQLVCRGVREKTFLKRGNTDVHIRFDHISLSVTVEIFDLNKVTKVKTVHDRRYYEVDKFPSEIIDVTFKLKKDCVVVLIKKKVASSWEGLISQQGF